MKGSSNIVSGFHCIKQANDHWQSFEFDHKGSKGAKVFEGYRKRLEWIVRDIATHPFLPESVREGIKAEWNSDAFAPNAIAEKAALLNEEQRLLVEDLIDSMLAGEEIRIEQID